MAERDPRVTPRPTDKVWFSGHDRDARTVEFVSVLGTIVYLKRHREYSCSLASWRRWAKGAKFKRAVVDPTVSVYEKVMIVSQSDLLELNRLRNRLDRQFHDVDHYRLAEENEIAVALMRLGFALVQHHQAGKRFREADLAKIIKGEIP